MGIVNMKTTRQVAFTEDALGAALPAGGDVVELFRLSDGEKVRWHPEEEDLLRVRFDCLLTTRTSITEVAFAVDESEDGLSWVRTQLVQSTGVEIDLTDELVTKDVSADGEHWSFSITTQAPYIRIRPYAKVGDPTGSVFSATAKISKEV